MSSVRSVSIADGLSSQSRWVKERRADRSSPRTSESNKRSSGRGLYIRKINLQTFGTGPGWMLKLAAITI